MPYKQPPKEYQWKKGQSGNLVGRPVGKTLKEFARDYLNTLSDDEKVDYLASLPADIVWRMAEGNPRNDIDFKTSLTISQVLDELEGENNTSRADK